MISTIKALLLISIITIFSSTSVLSAELTEFKSSLPEYRPISNLSGNISSIGSDTLANMMTLWSRRFKQLYPQVNIQIQAAGSATAPLALMENIATLGPMSRKMKPAENSEFVKKFGYEAIAIPVAIDALSVYVHKDNPLHGLTIAQVDAIFSNDRKCGYPSNISRWSQPGLQVDKPLDKINVFGRNSVSGTYSYFRKKALCKGHYKNTLHEKPGSAAVVEAVAADINAIGYSGIGYKTAGVRIVPLSKTAGEAFVPATQDAIVSGRYPLSRFLYIYINKQPGQPLKQPELEFIRMVLSQQGQQIVSQDGYIPLPAKIARDTLLKIR